VLPEFWFCKALPESMWVVLGGVGGGGGQGSTGGGVQLFVQFN